MALSKIDIENMVTGELTTTNGGTGATTLAGAGLAKRPNVKPLIINGDMAVAQRATSSTGKTSNGFYSCDRMELSVSGLGTHTIIQESLTSGAAFNAGFANAWRIDTTTADGSPGSGDELLLQYPMEGQDLQVFKKGTANAEKWTLAFWVKSTTTGTGQVNLSDMDNTRQCSDTYTISSADTWEHKILNFAADTTGAFGDDNGESLRIEWWLDSGSNYEGGAAPTAWEATANGDRNASGNLNIGSATTKDWAITGIQLEVGEFSSTTLPPFQHESFGDNLSRCQRYYYNLDIGGSNTASMGIGAMYTSSNIYCGIDFPVTMRATPSADFSTGTDYFAFNRNSATDSFDTLALSESSTTSAMLYGSGNISGTAGHGGRVRFNNSSAGIAFTSEL